MLKNNSLKFTLTVVGGKAHLAEPDDKIGWVNGVARVVKVTGIKEDMPTRDIADRLLKTNIPEWVFTLSFDQLGKNLHKADNLDDEQWASAPVWFTQQFPREHV